MPPKSREPEPPEDAVLDGDPSSDLETLHHREVRRLGFLVEAEARRALSEAQLEGDPQRYYETDRTLQSRNRYR